MHNGIEFDRIIQANKQMKIYLQLANERNNEEKILQDILKSKLILIDVFDKLYFVEKIHSQMKKGESKTLKIDEETKNYPNFLKTDLPRIIIQNDDEKIPFSEFIKKFSELKLEKKDDEYFLTIKKQNDSLNFNLKVDKDKTIDLKWISDNKGKKDSIYSGIKTYYYIKKNEN